MIRFTWDQLVSTDAHRHDAQVVHRCGPRSMIRNRDVQMVLLGSQTAGAFSCCSSDTHSPSTSASKSRSLLWWINVFRVYGKAVTLLLTTRHSRWSVLSCPSSDPFLCDSDSGGRITGWMNTQGLTLNQATCERPEQTLKNNPVQTRKSRDLLRLEMSQSVKNIDKKEAAWRSQMKMCKVKSH